MDLTIDITPELEARLREEAARHGVDPRQYVINMLRERLKTETASGRCLSATESRLLEEINRGLSEAQWKRYHELIEKRQAGELSEDERSELEGTATRLNSSTRVAWNAWLSWQFCGTRRCRY
jgi:hypothetical protein